MKEQNIKVIDLSDMIKFLWKSKIIILSCTILMIGLAIFGVNRNVKPSYMTSIQVRLPQYVDNRTVNTAVSYANGNLLKEYYRDLNMDPDYPNIKVISKAIKDSTIIRVQFVGQEPEHIKQFADGYQIKYINGLNRFINETAINDFEVSMVKSNSSINLSQLEKTLPLAKAEVIKDAGIPTENLNASVKTQNIIKFGALGLLLGCGISLVRYCALILR